MQVVAEQVIRRETRVERLALAEALGRIEKQGPVVVIAPEELLSRRVGIESTRLVWDGHLEDWGESPSEWGIDWRGAMRSVADQLGMSIWPFGSRTFLLRPATTVTMELEGMDVWVLLDLLSRNARLSHMVADTDLGTMDVRWLAEPWPRALAEICASQDLIDLREGRFIHRISTPEHEKMISTRPVDAAALAALGLGTSFRGVTGDVNFPTEGRRASAVLDEIGKAAGISVGIEAGIDGEVSLDLRGAPWREALEAIAWERDGVVWDEGKGSIRIGRIPTVTMEFQQASIQVVLELISQNAGVPIRLHYELDGSCGLNVHDAPWRDVVYSLSRNHPFHLSVDASGALLASPF